MLHVNISTIPPSNRLQSTWCLPPCGSTSWPAQSNPAPHTQRSGAENASWPLPHTAPPAAPPAGSACPPQRSALGYQSAAWGRKEWPADESASAGRGMLGYRCPDVGRWEGGDEEEDRAKRKEIRTKGHNLHSMFTNTCAQCFSYANTYSSTPYKSCCMQEVIWKP